MSNSYQTVGKFSMKTIKELSVEHGIDRSTLLKAAKQGRIPARQSGKTWLIDNESPDFKFWLISRKRKPLASPS